MFKMFTKMFFVKVKSKINGKEFICATRAAEAMIFATMLSATAIICFIVSTPIFMQLSELVAFAVLLALLFLGIYLALREMEMEPKDHCSKVFLQLNKAVDIWEQAGISKELANLMRIPINLGMQKVIDFQKEGCKRCKLPDSFFFSIRRIVKKIDSNIFYQTKN